MTTQIFPDYAALSAHAADYVAALVRRKPNAVLCLASGATPAGTYQRLAEQVRAGQLNLSQCRFIGLDEWVGFSPSDVGGCAYLLHRDLFTPAGIHPDQLTYFDAQAADLQAECERIDKAIDALGGLDLLLVGVGTNGHIALNEPGTPFTLRSHVANLAESTKMAAQSYFDQERVLQQGITLGLHYLTTTRDVVLMASGPRKAPAIHQALHGPVSEQCPASLLQRHPTAQIWLDEAATV